ncbi:MAG: hypothetical protein L3J74_07900 [Bacteroidales bacterium]|nr:hypothetical protein [Bacteroidales bacterium]
MNHTFSLDKKINKTLLIAYVLLNVVFPIIGLFSLIGDNEFHTSRLLTGTWRITFMFFSTPVYLIYAAMMYSDHFPKNNIKAFLLILPSILTYLMYFWSGDKSFFLLLADTALPIYTGLNFMFFIGLVILIVTGKTESKNPFLIAFGFLLLCILLFYPVAYFFVFSLSFHTYNDNLMMLFAILLFIFFHYKQLIKMYQEKVL